MSVFDHDVFANPSNQHRPLQIVHGLDHALTDPENLRGEEGIDAYLDRLLEMGTGGIVTRSHPEYVSLGVACYRASVRGGKEVRFDLPVNCRRFLGRGRCSRIAPRRCPG
jgi:hypothetical protein